MTGSPLSPPAGVRLAELLAVLSLGADLGMGQPMEHAMRQCLIALRLGDRLGLERDERASLYYVSLIAWVGCHIDAYEQAKWFGDDLALKGDFRLRDMTGMAPLAFMASHLGAGKPLLERARMGAKFLVNGHREVDDMLANHWYAADALAERLGLGQDVRATLFQTFERWDGKGVPSMDRAAGWMREEVRAGRLDGNAVEAVLRGAGHAPRRHKPQPSGLTGREVEVLRLLALGLTNKGIAAALVISPKTASRHIEHIYAKIGVSNRARASLFAATHGLMSEPPKMG